jgi:hypothetical protein
LLYCLGNYDSGEICTCSVQTQVFKKIFLIWVGSVSEDTEPIDHEDQPMGKKFALCKCVIRRGNIILITFSYKCDILQYYPQLKKQQSHRD